MSNNVTSSLKQSQVKIENIFMELALEKELRDIRVSDICKRAKINRSTFYANYTDIYDLLDTIHERLIKDFVDFTFFESSKFTNYLGVFNHVREHREFFNLYFKLGLDTKLDLSYYNPDIANENFNPEDLEYHLVFIKAGLSAILKQWISDGCDKEPKELVNILENEYLTRVKFINGSISNNLVD